jgi:hypothetical protein
VIVKNKNYYNTLQFFTGEEDNLESSVEKSSKPLKIGDTDPANYSTEMDGDSYFFTYFMLLCIIFIVGYVCYHNKQKVSLVPCTPCNSWTKTKL